LFREWCSSELICCVELYFKFYIHGPVHHESNLIIVQQGANYSVYYIFVGGSTCFRCRHPSSGARTAVITASGICQPGLRERMVGDPVD